MVTPGTTQCVVRPHPCAGLFSLINKVLTCMELYTRVQVEFPPEQTMFKSADSDIWSTMFESPPDSMLESDQPFDTIINYPHPTYTNKNAGDCYGRRDGWRFRLHRQFSRLQIRREIMDLAATIFPGTISDSIGLLYRGEKELGWEQRTGVLPSPEEMCSAVNRISGTHPLVFVCADSVEANERFKSALGERLIFWEQGDKCQKIGDGVHRVNRFGSEHVRKSLALVMALSKTRHFVHAVSNMATAVLYFNPWLPHTFVETKQK
jgi:hypothetical protein